MSGTEGQQNGDTDPRRTLARDTDPRRTLAGDPPVATQQDTPTQYDTASDLAALDAYYKTEGYVGLANMLQKLICAFCGEEGPDPAPGP